VCVCMCVLLLCLVCTISLKRFIHLSMHGNLLPVLSAGQLDAAKRLTSVLVRAGVSQRQVSVKQTVIFIKFVDRMTLKLVSDR